MWSENTACSSNAGGKLTASSPTSPLPECTALTPSCLPEPHTRQDLRQKPTIVVPYPLPSDTKSEFAHDKRRSTIRKASNPTMFIPNPYALPTDPKLASLNNQTQETASSNQSSHPPPSLHQSHLTTPENTPSSDPQPPQPVSKSLSHPTTSPTLTQTQTCTSDRDPSSHRPTTPSA